MYAFYEQVLSVATIQKRRIMERYTGCFCQDGLTYVPAFMSTRFGFIQATAWKAS